MLERFPTPLYCKQLDHLILSKADEVIAQGHDYARAFPASIPTAASIGI